MQLELFKSVRTTLTKGEICLKHSLKNTFNDLDNSTLNSIQIKQRISRQWDLGGGSSYPHPYCYIGGSNPRFWMAYTSYNRNPDFQGKQLITTIKKIFNIN